MKIAVIGTRGFPGIQGGVEKHCEMLYPILAKSGNKIIVFRRRPYLNQLQSNITYDNIQFIDLWCPTKQGLEAIVHSFASALICFFIRPDVVVIHNIGPGLAIPLLKIGFLTVALTYHSPNYEHSKWGFIARGMLRLGEFFTRHLADLVIFVSRDKCSKFQCKHKLYVPNGVVVSEKISAGETLVQFGLRKNSYILAVGRLVPEKGFHDLIEAFSRIDCDWKLALVGDADHEDAYSLSLKAKAKNTAGVVMTGFQKGAALGELYSNAGLFVLPSYHEGLPIVGLEAMSYELPMILSDIPANREIAEPQELFPVGDVEALAAKIKCFLDTPELLSSEETLTRKRERLDQEFNWDRIAEQTTIAYARALK